ncbi:WD40 repeat domain-containing protein [Streptomyces sp. NPDC058877]|uniref:WD40 repeat domain-containing protein n=1 Tax=unclassified Streptomyces TaxID=2593676 RepID=UPI0036D127A6
MSDGRDGADAATEEAGEGARLDDLAVLISGDPERVRGLLNSADGPWSRVAETVYRASRHVHEGASSANRRLLLALDAARYGDRELSERITATPVVGERASRWKVEWATGSMLDIRSHRTLTGHDDQVRAVAILEIDGRPHAVTGSEDSTVLVWDLVAGRQAGPPLNAPGRQLSSLAVLEIDGRPHAVTGCYDHTASIWDLTTRRQAGPPLTDLYGGVWVVATAEVDGRPHAVTSSGHGVLLVNDLVTRRPTQRLTGFNGTMWGVVTVEIDGRPHAVTSGDERKVRVWDLIAGRQVGAPLTGHSSCVWAMASAEIEGRPHVVTGSASGTVRVWDLIAGRQNGPTLTGHDDRVCAVAVSEFDGRPHAITGSDDGTVRVWDLISGLQVDQLLFPSPVQALATASNGRLLVGFGSEVAVLSRI